MFRHSCLIALFYALLGLVFFQADSYGASSFEREVGQGPEPSVVLEMDGEMVYLDDIRPGKEFIESLEKVQKRKLSEQEIFSMELWNLYAAIESRLRSKWTTSEDLTISQAEEEQWVENYIGETEWERLGEEMARAVEALRLWLDDPEEGERRHKEILGEDFTEEDWDFLKATYSSEEALEKLEKLQFYLQDWKVTDSLKEDIISFAKEQIQKRKIVEKYFKRKIQASEEEIGAIYVNHHKCTKLTVDVYQSTNKKLLEEIRPIILKDKEIPFSLRPKVQVISLQLGGVDSWFEPWNEPWTAEVLYPDIKKVSTIFEEDGTFFLAKVVEYIFADEAPPLETVREQIAWWIIDEKVSEYYESWLYEVLQKSEIKFHMPKYKKVLDFFRKKGEGQFISPGQLRPQTGDLWK